MKKNSIVLGALALALTAVAILACSKENTAQQETPAAQQTAEPQDYTLAEMIEAMSWEDGKAFFENQPIKEVFDFNHRPKRASGVCYRN